jgi:hypothetical protein
MEKDPLIVGTNFVEIMANVDVFGLLLLFLI